MAIAGCSTQEPSPQKTDYWAYAEFNLKMNLTLQFNTVSGAAALLGVDNVELSNGVDPQPDKRISDISGYTAGSSNSGSSCSATYINPPKGMRLSEATVLSSSSLSTETRIEQPQSLLSKKRLSYLREKYWNHELLYYVIDYIDQIVTQVPREDDQPNLSQPMQIKRSSKRLLVKNPKRRKLEEISEVTTANKLVFAKSSKNSNKYFPAKTWSLLEGGDYMIEFYSGETKRVAKRNIFDEFQDCPVEKKVMFLKPNRYGRRNAIPALVLDLKTDDGDILCNLLTDEGDVDGVHVSYLYLTDDILNELYPARKQTLILPIKKSKRCYTETAGLDTAADAKQSKLETGYVHIAGTEPEGAIDTGLEQTLDTDPDTTTRSCFHYEPSETQRILRFASYASSASSDDSDPLVPPLEVAEGCDPEKKFYVPFREINLRSKFFEPNKKNCDLLGPLQEGDWFKGLAFILTCSKYCQPVDKQEMVSDDENYVFSRVPFVYNHLVAQIKLGGGKIFESYSNVPSELIKNLVLIAPKPCLTARYIECMAFNVKMVCHEWIVNCCIAKAIIPHQELPLGWSVEQNRFISSFERQNTDPFANVSVRITSKTRDNSFFEFWSKVMRVCGAEVKPTRRVKFGKDLIILDRGYHYTELPIAVTPTWVIQCVLHGELKVIAAHEDYEYPLF